MLLACTSMSIGAQSLNDSSSSSVNKAHSNVEHPVNLFATNSQSTNNSASSNVADNGISIIEAKGWLESVYVKWMPLEGVDSYRVYIKGGQYTDYMPIDAELIRAYVHIVDI